MAMPDHPMRALKGTQAGKSLMAEVRRHRKPKLPQHPGDRPGTRIGPDPPPGAKLDDRSLPKQFDSYRQIAEKHLPK